MNITLSVDEQLLRKSREYAQQHHTSLNRLVRDYLMSLCGEQDTAASADEFKRLAKQMAGHSCEDFKFNRDSLYNRGLKG